MNYNKNFNLFINNYIKEHMEVIYSPYKEKFQNITGSEIQDDVFLEILLNARLFPHLNNKSPSLNLRELHFEHNFKLGKAAEWLYSQGNILPMFGIDDPLDLSKESFKEKGWAISKGFLDKEQVDSIKQQLSLFKYHVTSSADMSISRDEILSNSVDNLGKSAFSSQLKDIVIEEESPLGKVMACNRIASTVSKIAGCPMYLVESTAMYSKKDNRNNDDWKYTAKTWHLDYSHLKFIKVFIFLSDVPSSDFGSHSFVEGSHDDNLIYPTEKSDFWDARQYKSGKLEGCVKDEWVNDNYAADKIHAFCGQAGDVLFEDTSGLHKQGHCIAGDREILQLLFAVSNYGHLYTDHQFQINLKSVWPARSYLSPVSYKDREYQKKNKLLFPQRSKIRKILSSVKRNIKNILN